MENHIDLRKQNIIGKAENVQQDIQAITAVVVSGEFVTGAKIYMSVRQAETILTNSGFLEIPPEDGHRQDLNTDKERENIEKMYELAMLIRTIAKGVAGQPSELSIRDISTAFGMPTVY